METVLTILGIILLVTGIPNLVMSLRHEHDKKDYKDNSPCDGAP